MDFLSQGVASRSLANETGDCDVCFVNMSASNCIRGQECATEPTTRTQMLACKVFPLSLDLRLSCVHIFFGRHAENSSVFLRVVPLCPNRALELLGCIRQMLTASQVFISIKTLFHLRQKTPSVACVHYLACEKRARFPTLRMQAKLFQTCDSS